MTNRSDAILEQLRARIDAWQQCVEAAPASRIVSLDAADGDSPSFLDVAARLITATARRYDLSIVYAVHIDNWFGERWLGFCGKICGAAGVRNRTLKRSLTLPPFHPNRVLNATGHYLRGDGLYAAADQMHSLHVHQPSEANIDNAIRNATLHAWYSGNTNATKKGVVMVYLTTDSVTKAWYVMFDGDADWRLDRHVGISRKEVYDLIEAVA